MGYIGMCGPQRECFLWPRNRVSILAILVSKRAYTLFQNGRHFSFRLFTCLLVYLVLFTCLTLVSNRASVKVSKFWSRDK